MLKKTLIRLFTTAIFLYAGLIVFAWGFSDKLIFLPPVPGYAMSNNLISLSVPDSQTGKQHSIIAQYIKAPDARYTILYSHGNAVDLSGLKNLQKKFLRHHYSIMMYDYSGYGLSEGEPSEAQVYNDSQAIYDYLINHEGLKAEQIIIYGHSLGTAIATNLALHNAAAGLVLESPFTTAFRVKTVYPIAPFDKFRSINKLPEIHTPLLIMHSKDDSVIPYSHSLSLFQVAHQPKKLVLFDHAGHTEITHQGSRYWQSLQQFISNVQRLSDKNS